MAYTAYVSTLSHVEKDPNSDRLYTARVLDEGVLVGDSSYNGQRVVYFPSDGQICDYDFALAFGLLRKDAEGNPAGGYLENSRHVRAVKLRGLRSEGIVVPLDRFAAFYKLTEADFKDGEAIDKIGDTLICRKYIPNNRIRKQSGPALKKSVKPQYPEFQQHCETSQLRFCRGIFHEGDRCTISLKMHGTSQRSMDTYREFPRGFWRRLLRLPPKTERVCALGTRRTIIDVAKGDKDGSYGSNEFRLKHHKALQAALRPGMEVFYEVVGWVNESTPIMPMANNKKLNDKQFLKRYGPTTTFTYGCEPGESAMYIYRITEHDREYSSREIAGWCHLHGFNYVPQLETFEYTTWEDLMARVENWESGPDLVDSSHIREGVVIRIENRLKFTVCKSKGMDFKILEGICKANSDAPDIEEAEEDIDSE